MGRMYGDSEIRKKPDVVGNKVQKISFYWRTLMCVVQISPASSFDPKQNFSDSARRSSQEKTGFSALVVFDESDLKWPVAVTKPNFILDGISG